MGSSVQKLREEVRLSEMDQDRKQRMDEHLQLLERMVLTHLMVMKTRILDNDSHEDTHSMEQVNVELSSGSNCRTSHLHEAIKEYFKTHHMKGLDDIVDYLALSTVLGNESVGEYQSNKVFILWHNNTLQRFDAYCYRWNFAIGEEVIQDVKSVSGCLLMKRSTNLRSSAATSPNR
jgi:hypothetical protein